MLESLKRKYGDSLEDVLAFAEDARQRLTRLETSDDRLRRLAEETGALEEALARQALNLSKRRARAGGRLARAIVAELQDLSMPGAAFSVRLETHADPDGLALPDQAERVGFDVSGIDRGEFVLAVNPGQSPRPLAQVASGRRDVTHPAGSEIGAGRGGRHADADI